MSVRIHRGGGTSRPSRMKVGELAPDFSVTTIDGRSLSLSDYTGVKPVVLDFFATWCGPCIRELPALQAFYFDHSDKVEVIAISNEPPNTADAINKLMGEKGVTFPVIHNSAGDISNKFPTRSIPFLVFIDKDGIAIGTHMGYNPNEDLGQVILEEFGL